MLCVVLINSTFIVPKSTVCPGLTTFKFALLNNLCSSNLCSIKPIVSFVAYIGTLICFNKYGIEPIWSSCPCVITNPLIFSLFFSKYVKSGITKSIPSISSSGKAKPQSTRIMSFSYSNTVIFLPISSNPPNGIIFNFSFLNLNCSPCFLFLDFFVVFLVLSPSFFTLLFLGLYFLFGFSVFVLLFNFSSIYLSLLFFFPFV